MLRFLSRVKSAIMLLNISSTLLVYVLALVSSGIADDSESLNYDNTADAFPDRHSVEQPSLLDFHKYASDFGKRYPNLNEELLRRGIYLANAAQVFLSFISYRSGEASSYLAINHMSDWTLAERLSTHMTGDAYLAELSEDDIKQMLVEFEADLVSSQSNVEHENKRRKRSPDSEARGDVEVLSIDDLTRNPKDDDEEEDAETRAKRVTVVQSNNPNYESVDMISFGSDSYEDSVMPSIIDMADQLKPNTDTTGWLESLVHTVLDWMNPSRRPRDHMVFSDLRTTHCLAKPRNQGMCGSCYAFAAIALLEYQYCHDTGKLVDFSEQYMIDCGGRNSGIYACEGGTTLSSLKFMKNYGLELRSNYPYQAKNGTCPFEEDLSPAKMGFVKLGGFSQVKLIPNYLWASHLKRGPIYLSIKTNNPFSFYGGGVDMMKNSKIEHTHAMLLVGHGAADGKEYWLLRNSYGSLWGERGYYRLDKRSDCFLDSYGAILDGRFNYLEIKTINPYYKHGPVKAMKYRGL